MEPNQDACEPSLWTKDGSQRWVPRLRLASTFWERFAGLQLLAEFPADEALLIVPCHSVHTIGLRFPIDVAFLNEYGKVIRTVRRLPPFRFVWPVSGARFVIEFASGAMPIATGDAIAIQWGRRPPLPCLAHVPTIS